MAGISRREALGLIGVGLGAVALASCGGATAATTAALTAQAATPTSAAGSVATTAVNAAPTASATTSAGAAVTTTTAKAASVTATTASAAPAVSGQIELSLWHWDDFLQKPYQQEGMLFSQANPNIKVALTITSSGTFRQKLIAAIAGGDPPDLTGVTVTRPDFVVLASTDQLTHLGSYISRDKYDLSDFYTFNLKQHSWKGTQYSLPYSFNTTISYYNADLLTRDSVTTPTDEWRKGTWNWNTYKDRAQQLTSGNGASQQWGTVELYPTNTAAFFPMIWSNGGDLFDKDYTKSTLDDAPAMAAFQFWYDCIRYAPTAAQAKTAKYQNGNVAMWTDWDDRYQVYTGQVNFKYSIAPLPASPQSNTIYFVGNAPGFGIPKAVKHVEDSWSLLKFLLTPDSLTRVFLQTDNGPSRKSLANSKAFWLKDTQLADPALMADIALIRDQHTHNPPKVSNYDDMITALDQEMKPVWAGTQTLQVGVQQAAARWTSLLKQAQFDADSG